MSTAGDRERDREREGGRDNHRQGGRVGETYRWEGGERTRDILH